MDDPSLENGTMVISADGLVGRVTGRRACQLESCRGVNLRVVWPDWKWTWPCTKGMTFDDKLQVWRIGEHR